jgi:GxxExxY protein
MALEMILTQANKIMHDLGVGHKEAIYAKAFNVALNKYNIPHRSEVDIPIMYEGQCIGHGRADLIVDDLIIEMKAVCKPPKEVMGQLQKYVVNLSNVEKRKYKGVIINFAQNTGLVSILMYNAQGKAPSNFKSIANIAHNKKSKFWKK